LQEQEVESSINPLRKNVLLSSKGRHGLNSIGIDGYLLWLGLQLSRPVFLRELIPFCRSEFDENSSSLGVRVCLSYHKIINHPSFFLGD